MWSDSRSTPTVETKSKPNLSVTLQVEVDTDADAGSKPASSAQSRELEKSKTASSTSQTFLAVGGASGSSQLGIGSTNRYGSKSTTVITRRSTGSFYVKPPLIGHSKSTGNLGSKSPPLVGGIKTTPLVSVSRLPPLVDARRSTGILVTEPQFDDDSWSTSKTGLGPLARLAISDASTSTSLDCRALRVFPESSKDSTDTDSETHVRTARLSLAVCPSAKSTLSVK